MWGLNWESVVNAILAIIVFAGLFFIMGKG